MQRLQPNRRGRQQSQRIDVVGAGGRTPHRAPVQARRDRTARMSGQQFTDRRPCGHRLPGPYRGPDRLVTGVQTARMGQRHQLAAGQRPGVHHGRGARGIDRLARTARQVDPAMAAVPVRRRGVEGSHHRRWRSQWPLQAGRIAAGREYADQRRGQDRRGPSHLVSSRRHRQTGQPALWTKHLAEACKLLCAARNYRLTSRVCTASPVPLGVRTACRHGPVQRRVRHRSSRQGPASPVAGRQPTHKGIRMAVVTMKQLLDSGTHFGHQTRRWNPKMKRFIFTDRNGIYIIDLQQTLTYIDKAYEFVKETVAHGGSVMFVGTKKQAQESVAAEATRVGMPYVNQRWLGGMLTNFSTVHKRLQRLKELEAMEQTGGFEGRTKKEILMLTREKNKLDRSLGGIRDMAKVPSAVWVVDTNKEHIAVSEARKLGIPVLAILDTNCDPDLVDYPIPGNDDAIRSAALLTKVIASAVAEGLQARAGLGRGDGKPEAEAAEPLAEWEQELLASATATASVTTATTEPAPGETESTPTEG